jgi:DNA-directed RNA polymerase specialized sigma24 family protein
MEFEVRRPRLLRLAYQLLGSASEAEDAVQDAYLRLHAADHAGIRSLPAWLTKVVTNLCLNQLTSARAPRKLRRAMAAGARRYRRRGTGPAGDRRAARLDFDRPTHPDGTTQPCRTRGVRAA